MSIIQTKTGMNSLFSHIFIKNKKEPKKRIIPEQIKKLRQIVENKL